VAYYAASVDDAETNRKFAESLELDYPILSDPEKKTAAAYGVLTPDGNYARRHTIYIGADGKILDIDREVKPASAGADVASKLEALHVPKTK
jgi:thioredoxin-dependent peroxiredoxin